MFCSSSSPAADAAYISDRPEKLKFSLILLWLEKENTFDQGNKENINCTFNSSVLGFVMISITVFFINKSGLNQGSTAEETLVHIRACASLGGGACGDDSDHVFAHIFTFDLRLLFPALTRLPEVRGKSAGLSAGSGGKHPGLPRLLRSSWSMLK